MDSGPNDNTSWKNVAAQDLKPSEFVVFDKRIRSHDELKAYNELANCFHISADEGSVIDIRIASVWTGWLGIWRLTSLSAVRATARFEGALDRAVIQMPTSGRIEYADPAGPQTIPAGFGRVARHGDMGELQFSANYDAIECAILMEPLLEEMRASVGNGRVQFGDFETLADLTTPALRSFQRSVLATLETLSKSKAGLTDVLIAELLIHHLLGAWPRRSVQTGIAKPISSRHVQRSVDFIEANLSLPISVAEIAAAAGVGVRALQASFRKDLGRSPIQHMIERRLDRVHEELCRGKSTAISAAASRWGFIHMSDFSRRYRQRFGCTPSETQIRASQRS